MRAFARALSHGLGRQQQRQQLLAIHAPSCRARLHSAMASAASSEMPPSAAPPQRPEGGGLDRTDTPSKRPKRHFDGNGHRAKKQKKWKPKPVKEGSAEEVLVAEIEAMMTAQTLQDASPAGAGDGGDSATLPPDSAAPAPAAAAAAAEALPEPFSEIEVEVRSLSSTGDGLAVRADSESGHVYVVPFVLPGERARVKVVRHLRTPGPAASSHAYSAADFLAVVRASPERDDSLVRCRHFATCAGCQFQMLPYPAQLAAKRRVVQRAFAAFSGLAPELVPEVGETVPSPLQYGYRTKLTPHFDGPWQPSRRMRRGGGSSNGGRAKLTEVPPVGYAAKGRRHVIDIEECPIGTEAVQGGMRRERARMAREFGRYDKGATILLRESTERVEKTKANGARVEALLGGDGMTADQKTDAPVVVDGDGFVDVKTCITDNNATATEYVGAHVFENPAGAFFQNNNSILPVVTEYIREQILKEAAAAADDAQSSTTTLPPIRHLIDAYSGSGLFTIALSSLFETSTGIDIAASSIACARRNARLNGLVTTPEPADEATSETATAGENGGGEPKKKKTQCTFIAADAATSLFAAVPSTTDPRATVVVLDPPRKGCDGSFLSQLLAFGPRRVVYVSCNVHTQARDVGVLVGGDAGGGARYEIESVRGFDFFPQTAHVEGVAVLRRVYEGEGGGVEKTAGDGEEERKGEE